MLALEVAPSLDTEPPNIVELTLRVINIHEWAARTFSVLSVISVVSDIDLEVLKPLGLARIV